MKNSVRVLSCWSLTLLCAVFSTPVIASPQDNSLVIGASQEPRVLAGDFLNVIQGQAIATEIEQYLFAPILSINLESKNYPVMVTEAPTIENKRVKFFDEGQGKRRLELYLTLRQDLNWSDGKPITTDDIDFYYRVGKAKGMPVGNPEYWERVGLTVKDKYDFIVSFKPAYYTDLFGGFRVPMSYAPAHIMRDEWKKTEAAAAPLDPTKDAEKLNELYHNFFQKFSTPEALNNGAMVYSGPFMLKRWVPGNSIELVRNPNFFITPPGGTDKYIQKIIYRFIQNTNSLLVAILGGQVDVTSFVALTFDQARSPQLTSRAPGRFDIWFVPGSTWERITINTFANVQRVKELGLDNPKTRQALTYALNREGLIQAFFDNLQPLGNTWIAPVNPLSNQNVKKYSYNVELARKMLAELGWKPGPDGILQRTVDGRTVKFEIEYVTTAGNAVRERTQQYFADNLKRVGIALKINNAPSAIVFASEYQLRAAEGKWTGFFEYASTFSLIEQGNLYACKDLTSKDASVSFVPTKENNYQGSNVGGWCSDAFDKLRAQAVVEFDEKKRKTLFDQMQAIWADQLPVVPLYYRATPYVVSKGLLNYLGSAYAGGFGYPSWQSWNIGWEQRGAKRLYDQTKYALTLKK
ncbi:peptide ABC transporter substrate-binding protein [Candidatus Acetothermia bacterium]|nr:peptide ABC transporter substrate-binding protein [Candidatus Acetothermia bacterium]